MPDNSTTPKKKKKTSVALPGSLKNLVHNVQNNAPQPAQQGGVGESAPAAVEPAAVVAEPAPAPVAPVAQTVEPAPAPVAPAEPAPAPAETPAPAAAPAPQAEPAAPQPAPDEPAAPAKTAKKATAKQRAAQRPTEDDTWDAFLDLAREYKTKDSHLATIYIDRDLKNVLDRLRAARDVKMPTTAILSAIVARFIYDNEKRIKDAIYGDRLI